MTQTILAEKLPPMPIKQLEKYIITKYGENYYDIEIDHNGDVYIIFAIIDTLDNVKVVE